MKPAGVRLGKTMLETLNGFFSFSLVLQYPRQSLELPYPITVATQMPYCMNTGIRDG